MGRAPSPVTVSSQETETAVRLGLNVVVLILEDFAYGMICRKQAVLNFRIGPDLWQSGLRQYAESYGAVGRRAERTPRP
jgi:acetolactate synthase I/II/III large subunit